jgi:hypothetical protein
LFKRTQKAIHEAERGEHEGGGRQYRRYAAILNKMTRANPFLYEGSMKYQSTDDLRRLDLIQSSHIFDTFKSQAELQPYKQE